jgi:hypothetical protein
MPNLVNANVLLHVAKKVGPKTLIAVNVLLKDACNQILLVLMVKGLILIHVLVFVKHA